MKLLIMQCSPSPYYTPLLEPGISLSTLFLDILSLCSSLSVRDQVSHPCTTIDKVIVLYVLILLFLDSNALPNSSRHFLNSVCS
jgi:hypothetical protein